MRVGILVAHYLPGRNAGGPIRSISNLIEQLGEQIEFRVVTANHDHSVVTPFDGIENLCWSQVGKALVKYIPPGIVGQLRVSLFAMLPTHDVVYLNSLFGARYSVLPLWASLLLLGRRKNIAISPRGELAEAALNRSRIKKFLYLEAFKLVRLEHQIVWVASSGMEEKDIRRVFGSRVEVLIAPPIGWQSSGIRNVDRHQRYPKNPGELRLAYVGRIHPHKNLAFALKVLEDVEGNIRFDIFGPMEDPKYWRHCEHMIKALRGGIEIVYRGVLDHDDLLVELRKSHLMILPTKSENYGHAIVESLSNGCPVVISDRTPWRKIQECGAGWNLPLESPELFVQALQGVVNMNELNLQAMREAAMTYAVREGRITASTEENMMMFRHVQRRAPKQNTRAGVASLLNLILDWEERRSKA